MNTAEDFNFDFFQVVKNGPRQDYIYPNNFRFRSTPSIIDQFMKIHPECGPCWSIFGFSDIMSCLLCSYCPKGHHIVSSARRPIHELRIPIFQFYKDEDTGEWFLTVSACSSYYYTWCVQKELPIFIGGYQQTYDSDIHHFLGCMFFDNLLFFVNKKFHLDPIFNSGDTNKIGLEITNLSREAIDQYLKFKSFFLKRIKVDTNGKSVVGVDLAPIFLTMNPSFLEAYSRVLLPLNKISYELNSFLSFIKSIQKILKQISLKKIEFINSYEEYKKTEIYLELLNKCEEEEKRNILPFLSDVNKLIPVKNQIEQLVLNNQINLPKNGNKKERLYLGIK